MGAGLDVSETPTGLTTMTGRGTACTSTTIPSCVELTMGGGQEGGQYSLTALLGDGGEGSSGVIIVGGGQGRGQYSLPTVGDHTDSASLTVGDSAGLTRMVGGGTVCPSTVVSFVVREMVGGGQDGGR